MNHHYRAIGGRAVIATLLALAWGCLPASAQSPAVDAPAGVEPVASAEAPINAQPEAQADAQPQALSNAQPDGQSETPSGAEPLATLPVAAASEVMPAPAAAAPVSSAPQLEEVVVTSTHKAQNLQDVNIAVTALTPEALQDNVLQSVRDLDRITPSMTMSQSPGQGINPIVALRGQVQNDSSLLTLDPSVGIYLDEIYLGRSPGSLLDFFDVERVEVLKGPQGTLYGRNTTGGAIRVIPVKANPNVGWDGFVRGGLGNYGTKELEAASNVPVLDDLALRVGVSARYRDGWGRRYTVDASSPGVITGSQRVNNKESVSGRLGGVWNLGESLRLELGGDYTDQRTNGASAYDADGDLAIQPVPGGPITGYRRSSSNYYSFASDVQGKASAKTGGGFVKAEYDLSFATLKLIEGYRQLDYQFQLDVDGTSAFGAVLPTTQSVDQNSTELQMLGKLFDDRLEYVLGVYAFAEHGKDDSPFRGSELLLGGTFATLPSPLPPIVSGLPTGPGDVPTFAQTVSHSQVDNESQSIFLQSTYHFTDQLGLTAGVRPIRDSKRLDRSVIDPGLLNLTIGPGLRPGGTYGCIFDPSAEGVTNDGHTCRFDLTTVYHYTAYTAGFDWKPIDDLLIYLKTSRGARSGGQQGRGTDAATLTPFNPEFVHDYELGIKGEYFQRRALLNFAAYHSDYTNYQVTELQGVATVVRNADSAKINGLELEAMLAVSDTLTLNASGSYINFKFDGDRYIAAFAPKFQYSASVNYKQPFVYGDLGMTLGYSWRDEQALYPNRAQVEANPNLRQDAYGLINASAYVNFAEQALRVGLFGANLADQHYKVNTLPSLTKADSSTGGVISPGSPRTYGLEIVKRFGG